MKKIISLSLIVALSIGFVGCKKNTDSLVGTNPNGTSNTNSYPVIAAPPPVVIDPLLAVGPLPMSYTKKALLEEFTGEWCQWCPQGAEAMTSIIAANAGKVIGIAVHDGDPMEVPAYNTWITGITSVGGYPNASVDRANATGAGSWSGEVSFELAKTAKLGLAMVNKTTGKKVTIKLFIGYPSNIPSGSRLTVAVVEDKVPQSFPGAQSTNPTTAPLIVPGWTHGHVLRGVVTSVEGDIIALNSTKNYTIVEFKDVDLSKMNIQNMANVEIAAFINRNVGTRDVYNVQEAGLNETKKWD